MKTLAVILLLAAAAAPAAQQDFDLVVYGATAGGVMTAVAGARQGLKTVLLEPRAHLGGMATGGLSRTDVGKREVIGGLALEFYFRVGVRYEMRPLPEPRGLVLRAARGRKRDARNAAGGRCEGALSPPSAREGRACGSRARASARS